MGIGLSDVVHRNDEKFLASELGDELVMMNLENGNVIGMNSFGSDIWKLTEGPTSINEITSQLLTQYDVGEEECKNDVHEFISMLVEKEILVKQ